MSRCLERCDAACVHGHEDPSSRGPSGFDPPTPARIRHTRTPMLRARVQMLRWGPATSRSLSSSAESFSLHSFVRPLSSTRFFYPSSLLSLSPSLSYPLVLFLFPPLLVIFVLSLSPSFHLILPSVVSSSSFPSRGCSVAGIYAHPRN